MAPGNLSIYAPLASPHPAGSRPSADLQRQTSLCGFSTAIGSKGSDRDLFLTPACPNQCTEWKWHATMAENLIKEEWIKRLLPGRNNTTFLR